MVKYLIFLEIGSWQLVKFGAFCVCHTNKNILFTLNIETDRDLCKQCRPWSNFQDLPCLSFSQQCLDKPLSTCGQMNLPILTLLLLNMTCPVLANSVDPDQLASEEANSGSGLFVIKYVNFYRKPWSSNLTGWKLEVGVAS